MTRDGPAALLIDHAPGEVRAAALDGRGRAWHLFVERWAGEDGPAWQGQHLTGRLRAIDSQTGNGFVELETGEEALLRLPRAQKLTEGQALRLRLASESRQGKLARVSLDPEEPPPATPFDAWLATVPFVHAQPDPVTDRLRLDQIFEEAMAPMVSLPRGGRLQIERTQALTAIDVDTAGRSHRGSSGARAVALGREAAGEAARQVLLRRLGGLVVMDCPGPLNRAGGAKIQATMVETFDRMTTQAVQVDGPSRLGLLQAALEWRFRPVNEIMQATDGEEHGDTGLLRLLRVAENEAQAQPAAFFHIVVSGMIAEAYQRRRTACDQVLQKRFHGRLRVRNRTAGPSEVLKA